MKEELVKRIIEQINDDFRNHTVLVEEELSTISITIDGDGIWEASSFSPEDREDAFEYLLLQIVGSAIENTF